LLDHRSRAGVEVAERYADGGATAEDLAAAKEGAGLAVIPGHREEPAAWAAWSVAASQPWRDTWRAHHVARYVELARPDERRRILSLLRDVSGNPFAPLPPRRFPDSVVALARVCYDGDHSAYPILADALEELGESRAGAHCRELLHARGCHVLDWVLGKE